MESEDQLSARFPHRDHASASSLRAVRTWEREHVLVADHGPADAATHLPLGKSAVQPDQDHDPQPHGRLPRHDADGLSQDDHRSHDLLPDPSIRRLRHHRRHRSLLRLSSDRDSNVGFGHRVRQGDSTILATLHFALILGEDGAARDRPRAPCSSAGGHSIHPRDPSRDEHDSPKRRKPGHRVLHPDDEEQASSSSIRSHDLRSDERLRYPSNTSVRRRTRYLLLSPTRIHQ